MEKTVYLVKEKDSVIYVSYDKDNIHEFMEVNSEYYHSLTVEEVADNKLFLVLCSNIRRHKGLYGSRIEVFRSYGEYRKFMYGEIDKPFKTYTTYKFNGEKDSYDKQVKELLSKIEKDFGKEYILYSK